MTETNNSLMSAPGHRGDGTAARAVCDGRFYYIGSGDGKYDPHYAIDLHDDTVRTKDTHPLP